MCPPFGNFHNSIGLRQRDPLSQCLFILGAEVLSHIFTKAEEIGSIQGVGVARNAPRISHLFFADDGFIYLLFFCNVKIREVREKARLRTTVISLAN